MAFVLQGQNFFSSPQFSGAAYPSTQPAVPPSYQDKAQSVTDKAIAQFSTYFTRNSQAIQQAFRSAVAARYLPSLPSVMSNSAGDCHNVNPGTSLEVVSGVQGIATSIPIVGGIVSEIAGIFGANHAKAVVAEAEAICGGVPAANNAFHQIEQGLESGQITPSQAKEYYSQIQSQFSTRMKTGTSYKNGDGLWLFDYTCQAICYARSLEADGMYQPPAAQPILQQSPVFMGGQYPPTQPTLGGSGYGYQYGPQYPGSGSSFSGLIEVPTWAIIVFAAIILIAVLA